MASPRQIWRLLQHVYEHTSTRKGGSRAIHRVVVNIIGHKGIFKTQLVEAFARQYVGDYEVLHLGALESPGDVWGVPKEVRGVNGWTTVYARPAWWPDAKTRPVGVFHLDEPNRANALVMPLLLDFLIYRRVGPRTLPPGWMIVSTMNPSSDEGEYAVSEMDTAIMDRMLHVTASLSPVEWLEGFAIPRGVHPDLQDLILQDPSLLSVKEAPLPKIEPSPRSYEMLDLLYEPGMARDLLQLISVGLLGTTVGSAVAQMLTRAVKPLSPLEILDHYDKIREYVQVYGSRRFAQWDVLVLTIEALNRSPLPMNPKRLRNLARFRDDLPADLRGHLKLWTRTMKGASA